MEIVRLPAREAAPEDSDCISLRRLPDGRYRLEASALASCETDEEADSIALVDGGTYDSVEQGEAAGIAWAEEQCVATLFVSTNA